MTSRRLHKHLHRLVDAMLLILLLVVAWFASR